MKLARHVRKQYGTAFKVLEAMKNGLDPNNLFNPGKWVSVHQGRRIDLMLIEQFEKNLFGCRFCPMCKPYGEVGEIKKDEPHSTRVRGLLLWKILKGYAEYDEDVARIIYDSTLDTVSQAWCVNHYPVADIVLSARADIFNAGLAPDTVKNYSPTPAEEFSRELSQFNKSGASTVLYPGDAMAGDNIESTKALAEFVSKHDPQLTLPDFTMIAALWHIAWETGSLPKSRLKKLPPHFPRLIRSLWMDPYHIGSSQIYTRDLVLNFLKVVRLSC